MSHYDRLRTYADTFSLSNNTNAKKIHIELDFAHNIPWNIPNMPSITPVKSDNIVESTLFYVVDEVQA